MKKELTQEEKNIKIAEFCGINPYKYQFIYQHENGSDYSEFYNFKEEAEKEWKDDYGGPEYASPIKKIVCVSNYFKDLNEINIAEKYLLNRGDEWGLYCDNLLDIIVKTYGYQGAEMLIHASASQRAEALGKTLKLW